MKAVIFDMDGTMIDNMMIHHKSWRQVLANYGHEMTLEEVHKELHGVNLEILERIFGDQYSPEDRLKISNEKEEIYQAEYRDKIALLPGLDQFLHSLREKGIPMALASAAPAMNVDFVLDTLDLKGLFSSILHADHVDRGKPHPEIYLRTAEILKVDPEDCVVFEDSPTGANAAAAANAEIMVVTTTHRPEEFIDIDGISGFISDFNDPMVKSLV